MNIISYGKCPIFNNGVNFKHTVLYEFNSLEPGVSN